MIVCQRCGKENQDHYKFCLGCGAEISAAAAGNAAVMKTMMSEVDLPTGPSSAPVGPPPGVGLPSPSAIPAISNPAIQQQQIPQTAPAEASAPKCMQCQADIPPNFKFCGVCGTPIQEVPPQVMAAAPAAPVAPATLQAFITLVRPDGNDGGTHTLQLGINKLGRNHGEIFASDGYLSPEHGELELTTQGVHTVRDRSSLNGIFVRITEEQELTPGQIIRIGQELLQFDLIRAPGPLEDGTEIMGSPNPGFWGKITVIVGKEVTSAAYPLLGDSITMGREQGDINFPDDGYVSGMHARLVTRDNKVFLSDMGSSNGTFMKVSGEQQVENNSFILLGQQLFRLTIR